MTIEEVALKIYTSHQRYNFVGSNIAYTRIPIEEAYSLAAKFLRYRRDVESRFKEINDDIDAIDIDELFSENNNQGGFEFMRGRYYHFKNLLYELDPELDIKDNENLLKMIERNSIEKKY